MVQRKQTKNVELDKQVLSRARQSRSRSTSQSSIDEIAASSFISTDSSTMQRQSAQLRDTRIQASQRQMLASQIGQTRGNHYLQRILAQTEEHGREAIADETQNHNHVPIDTKSSWLVQRLGEPLDKDETVTPVHGETEGEQRKYSVGQYISMWEQEQGETLSDREKRTLARGCIGITALNLSGGGNPPLDQCYATFDQAKAAVDKANRINEWLRSIPFIGYFIKEKKAVLFAKMFWSNQDEEKKKRRVPDPTAFLPDKDGKVDMNGYKYRDRPGFVNFDYAFWDEASQSFWHANHSEPGMEVYQSTKEKFAEGYPDFDRVIYCVAYAENYDPAKAAITH